MDKIMECSNTWGCSRDAFFVWWLDISKLREIRIRKGLTWKIRIEELKQTVSTMVTARNQYIKVPKVISHQFFNSWQWFGLEKRAPYSSKNGNKRGRRLFPELLVFFVGRAIGFVQKLEALNEVILHTKRRFKAIFYYPIKLIDI